MQLAAACPHLMAPSVPRACFPPSLTLELPPLHRIRVSDTSRLRQPIVELGDRVLHTAAAAPERGAQPSRRGCLAARSWVQQVMRAVDYVRSGLVARTSLRDRGGRLSDPHCDPTLLRLLEHDRQMLYLIVVSDRHSVVTVQRARWTTLVALSRPLSPAVRSGSPSPSAVRAARWNWPFPKARSAA